MPAGVQQVSASAVAADANGIAQSQSLAAAGALNLNGSLVSGGVATLLPVQPVVITSAGNDSGINFTITGTDYGGSPISESLAGGNIAAVTSKYQYATVTSIKASGATASTVTAGVSGTVFSPWLILGNRVGNYAYRLRALLSTEAGTFVVQGTSDPNIMMQSGGYADDIEQIQASGSTSVDQVESAPWTAVRLQVSAGSVTLRAIQSRTA